MRKLPLTDFQMTSAAFVERAARLSRDLTRMRARGPGDIENAMRSIERDYAIDYWTIWRLRYRCSQIKDIGASVLARIEAAYLAECERQRARLIHEIKITRTTAGPDHPAVVAAEALVGTQNSEPPASTDDAVLHAVMGKPHRGKKTKAG